MTLQSYQSPVFGLAVLYPTRSEISRFWYIKTRGRKIAIEFFFLAILISTLWRSYRAKKKKFCDLHFNFFEPTNSAILFHEFLFFPRAARMVICTKSGCFVRDKRYESVIQPFFWEPEGS